MQTKTNEKARVQVNNAARLEAAKSAEKRLKKERLSEADRQVFARNLGTMLANCTSRDPKLTMRKLFFDTFGPTAGESIYKKRKRLISLPTEGNDPAKLIGKGRQYLELALCLSSHLEATADTTESQKKQYAILQLIQGSTFDNLLGHKERSQQEYRSEIYKRLCDLAKKVATQVDLDWMRTWVLDHPTIASGRTGTFSELTLGPLGDNDEGTLDLNGPIDNCLAPCVRIGIVKIHMPIYNYIDVEVDVDEVAAGKSKAEMIRKALTKKLGLEKDIDEDCYEKSILGIIASSEDWVEEDFDCSSMFITNRLLDLEIRYDETSGSWMPCLLLRFEMDDGIILTEEEYIEISDTEIVFYFGSGSGICLAIQPAMHTYRLFFVETTNMYNRGRSNQYSPYNDWTNCTFKGLSNNEATHPLDEKFYDFLLEVEKSKYPYCYLDSSISIRSTPAPDSEEDAADTPYFRQLFVKAPHGSISSHILKNLAYAKEEERLDNVLISDATKKYKLLKEFAEHLSKSYEEAISNVDFPT